MSLCVSRGSEPTKSSHEEEEEQAFAGSGPFCPARKKFGCDQTNSFEFQAEAVLSDGNQALLTQVNNTPQVCYSSLCSESSLDLAWNSMLLIQS